MFSLEMCHYCYHMKHMVILHHLTSYDKAKNKIEINTLFKLDEICVQLCVARVG